MLGRTQAGGSARSGRATGRAVAAVGIGNAVEWYDFAVYGAFATVLGAAFFPAGDRSIQLLLAFAVYGTALLVRPLGAALFGRLGDTRGRRPTMTLVIGLMAVATAAVGVLPGYAAIGIAAPVILVLLRALQGLAAGGELGVSSVFIFEHAPARRRGTVASWQITSLSLGMAGGMAVAGVASWTAGGAAIHPAWWRTAFLIALPLGLVGLYVRSRAAETAQFLALPHAQGTPADPWREFWAHHRRQACRGFVLMAAGSLAYNTYFIFLPNHLVAVRGVGLASVLFISAGNLVVTALSAAILGYLSDRVGRRRVVAASALTLAALAAPMAMLASRSAAGLLLAQFSIGIAIGGVMSVALLAESFPSRVRSTALAMTAGMAAALVGGTAPFLEQLMVELLGLDSAPGVYVAAVACLAVVAVMRWEKPSDHRLGSAVARTEVYSARRWARRSASDRFELRSPSRRRFCAERLRGAPW